jgi:hypothetical protein
MVTRRADNGMLYKEPPYTDEEIAAFYETCGTINFVGTTRPRRPSTVPQGPQRKQDKRDRRQTTRRFKASKKPLIPRG